MSDDYIEDPLDSLEDVIRYLELERDYLKKRIDECVEEWEFTDADAYAKSYKHISRRLDVLKNFRDPTYDERAKQYRKLIHLEEKAKEYAHDPRLLRKYRDALAETNQTLDNLESRITTSIETQHLDDALFQLVEGTIEGFKLHLSKSDALVFHFLCQNKNLHVEISARKSLFPFMKKKLRRIGFTEVDNARRFVYDINVANFKDAQKIKQLLAVVIFDAFGKGWYDDPATLEILYK